jgi:hypothetical protein
MHDVDNHQSGLASCSLCLSVLDDDRWIVVEQAIAELRSFETPTPPRLGPGICDACADALRRLRTRDIEAVAA